MKQIMKNRYAVMVNILVLFGMLIFSGQAGAQDIKERMKQRLPVIVDLKSQGIVGESNQGYLAFVSGKKAQEALVESENQDRKSIYMQIAKQQNTSLDLVEKRRAMVLADRAIPGEFIQKPDGSWIQK